MVHSCSRPPHDHDAVSIWRAAEDCLVCPTLVYLGPKSFQPQPKEAVEGFNEVHGRLSALSASLRPDLVFQHIAEEIISKPVEGLLDGPVPLAEYDVVESILVGLEAKVLEEMAHAC